MTLFEAGILAKMTTDEYKNLPEQSRRSHPVTESDKQMSETMGDSSSSQGNQDKVSCITKFMNKSIYRFFLTPTRISPRLKYVLQLII